MKHALAMGWWLAYWLDVIAHEVSHNIWNPFHAELAEFIANLHAIVVMSHTLSKPIWTVLQKEVCFSDLKTSDPKLKIYPQPSHDYSNPAKVTQACLEEDYFNRRAPSFFDDKGFIAEKGKDPWPSIHHESAFLGHAMYLMTQGWTEGQTKIKGIGWDRFERLVASLFLSGVNKEPGDTSYSAFAQKIQSKAKTQTNETNAKYKMDATMVQTVERALDRTGMFWRAVVLYTNNAEGGPAVFYDPFLPLLGSVEVGCDPEKGVAEEVVRSRKKIVLS